MQTNCQSGQKMPKNANVICESSLCVICSFLDPILIAAENKKRKQRFNIQ